jgi:hypothetical protein
MPICDPCTGALGADFPLAMLDTEPRRDACPNPALNGAGTQRRSRRGATRSITGHRLPSIDLLATFSVGAVAPVGAPATLLSLHKLPLFSNLNSHTDTPMVQGPNAGRRTRCGGRGFSTRRPREQERDACGRWRGRGWSDNGRNSGRAQFTEGGRRQSWAHEAQGVHVIKMARLTASQPYHLPAQPGPARTRLDP